MIEYHDTLNPKLWENNILKIDVKNKLLEIYQTFISKLKENEIPIEVIDVLLLGSNAAYNYTDNSDIDLHIITDFSNIPLNDTLTQLFYNNEKAKFNDDYDIFIKGLPVEVYIEDINAGNKSEGVYSLLQDKWLKFPQHNPPAEVDYSQLLDIYKTKISDAITSNSPEKIKQTINEIRMLRKMSLMDGGIYSKGNLVFKELRNDGSIDSLYTSMKELTSKELSLENVNINGIKIAYRYDDNDEYEVGDVIYGYSASERKIDTSITDIYSKECSFDFNKKYTYAYLERRDDTNPDYSQVYKVEVLGDSYIGSDDYSIDVCNAELKDINKIQDDWIIPYKSKIEKPLSIISHACRILDIIKL